ncbi:MAG: non-canonical purine NTP pyrophosphatase [Polyangiaceae bacterium]
MPDVLSIVVATANRSRLADIKSLVADLPVEVLSAVEALGDRAPTVSHDGDTIESNALKKAEVLAAASLMITIADDAGLEVAALGGRPGARSARFAGEGATDAENNAELLRRMDEVEDDSRDAVFRAVLALVDPWHGGKAELVEGRLEGRIARTPSGTGGFGYEPLFIIDAEGRTLAELTEEERNEQSHRGRALQALRPKLEALIRSRLAEAEAVLEGSWVPPPSTRSPV